MGMTAAIAAAAVLAGGCGTGYTKRDFVARAQAICTSALREARSIPPPGNTSPATPTGTGLSAYLARLLPVVQTEFQQLRALPRPPEDAQSRTIRVRWLAALAQDLDSYRSLAAAARQGDTDRATAAEAALRASPAASLAASYGLPACASPGGTVA